MINHYQVLGLDHTASADQIRRAYQEYAAHYEPARHANSPFFTERFKEVLAAYETLNDPVRRQEYDVEYHIETVKEAGAGRARAMRSNNFLFFLLGAALIATAAYGWRMWEGRQAMAQQQAYVEQRQEALAKRSRLMKRINTLIDKQAYPQAVQVADSALSGPPLAADTLAGDSVPPSKSELAFLRALAKNDMQNDTGAVHDYTLALNAGFGGGSAFNNRGILRQKLGDVVGAEQDYFMATMLNPEDASYHYNLGVLYYDQNNLHQAEVHFVAATRINSALAEAWYNLGNVQYGLKKQSEACKAWQKAAELGIDPANDNLSQFCR